MFNRWRKKNGAAAVAEPVAEAKADPAAMLAEVDRLVRENRQTRSVDREIAIRKLRHEAGIAVLSDASDSPSFAEPSSEVPARGEQSRLPEINASELTGEVLRGAILEAGALLVRGLIDRDRAVGMAEDIERAVVARQELRDGGTDELGLYDEIETDAGFPITVRDWVEEGGGLLAVDSPRLLFDMLESFSEVGMRDVVEGYLGERAAISAQKCTLRKATPDVGGAWHQDGSFMGDVRSLNVWVSLSRCGDVAPSMDVVPRRLEEYVPTGGEGTYIENQISHLTAEKAAGEIGIVRPIFDPGDALLFDEIFLHQTGSDPEMPNPRYAIESWFFGASAYPKGYAPIAL
ncbi:hypothetical protein BH10ACT11_BH10ACT11_11020 [soil metagenome]